MTAEQHLGDVERRYQAAIKHVDECLREFDESEDTAAQFRSAMFVAFALKDERRLAEEFRDAQINAHEEWARREQLRTLPEDAHGRLYLAHESGRFPNEEFG